MTKKTMTKKTLAYYIQNADIYITDTLYVDFSSTQEKFCGQLHGPKILDFGCGSGRDTKYFLEKGLDVTAIDGSAELCKLAGEYTGITVQNMLFQELDDNEKYDGIWACASILHLSQDELKIVLRKMIRALKEDGVIYTSFKNSEFEGYRGERYYTDFTLEKFREFIADIEGIVIEEHWLSGDVRNGREDEQWLNLIMKKQTLH